MWILNKHPQAEGNLAKHQDIRMLTVTQHGMCGDGVSNDTAAIQAAIDAAAAHGGGTVVVPPGRYRVGTVFLRDRIRLHLEAGIGCRERRGTRRGPARGRRQHQSPPGDPACPRAGSRSLARFGTRRMRAGDVSVTEHECETVGCSEQMPADQLHGFWKEMSDRGGMLQRAERARLDVHVESGSGIRVAWPGHMGECRGAGTIRDSGTRRSHRDLRCRPASDCSIARSMALPRRFSGR